MLFIPRLYAWAVAHPEAAFALAAAAVALLRAVYTVLSRLVAPYPRVRAALEAVAALAPDVARFIVMVLRVVTGRQLPAAMVDVRDAEIEQLRRQLSATTGRLQVLEASRLADATAGQGPMRASLLGPSGGQRGRVAFGPLCLLAAPALALSLLIACTHGCHPQPVPPSDGAVVSVGGWTDTARQVLSTLGWAIPAARVVIVSILPEPAASVVGRVLDSVADAATRLQVALDAYTARGGDRCAVYAAAGGVHVALTQLLQVLTDHGIALGVPLEHVLDAAGAVVDNLVPRCDASDAGWSSAGDRGNTAVRAAERSAAQRGVILRRDLDNIRPTGGAR